MRARSIQFYIKEGKKTISKGNGCEHAMAYLYQNRKKKSIPRGQECAHAIVSIYISYPDIHTIAHT